MGIDDVVQMTIDRDTRVPSQEGFGTPIFVACHNVTGNRLDVFTDPKEVTDAGFAVTSEVYKGLNKIFSQNPRPPQVVVGKRLNKPTQIVQLIPKNVTQGFVYNFTFTDSSGLATAISLTVGSAATIASNCTALAALLSPLADSTAVATATEVTVTESTAGIYFDMSGMPNPDDLAVKDTTTDPGITADLTAIENATTTPTDWYMMLFDHTGKAEAEAVAAWVESRRRMALVDDHDSQSFDPSVTNDYLSDVKGLSYVRTGSMTLSNQVQAHQAAAWAGSRLPKVPGKENWAFATLVGIAPDTLKGIQSSTVHAKNGNTYESIKNVGVALYGRVPGNDWINTIRGIDCLYARLQENLFALEIANDNIPFTDAGIAMIKGVLLTWLNKFADPKDPVGGLLVAGTVVVNVPKAVDVSPSDKANRILIGVTFSAELAGSINQMQIAGTVTL